MVVVLLLLSRLVAEVCQPRCPLIRVALELGLFVVRPVGQSCATFAVVFPLFCVSALDELVPFGRITAATLPLQGHGPLHL